MVDKLRIYYWESEKSPRGGQERFGSDEEAVASLQRRIPDLLIVYTENDDATLRTVWCDEEQEVTK